MEHRDPIAEFSEFLHSYGYVLDGPVEFNSDRFIYCRNTNRNDAKKKCWYKAWLNPTYNTITAIYGDWTYSSESEVFKSEKYQALDVVSRAALDKFIENERRKAKLSREKVQKEAAKKARKYIDSLAPAKEHPYIDKKKIKPEAALFDKKTNSLVLPYQDAKGVITGYQEINALGVKMCAKDCKKKGSFIKLGRRFTSPTYICEGWATACTVREATGKTVLAAIDAYNLLPVAESVRACYNVPLVIAADNDHTKEKNTGLETAQAVMEALKNDIEAFYPEDIDGTDFNDLHVERGLDAVKDTLKCDEYAPAIPFLNLTEPQELKPLDFILEDYLVAGTTSLFFGEPGARKSFIFLDIGLCVAAGKDWHGFRVDQTPVIYVAGEGHQDLKLRIDGWKKENGIDHGEIFPFYSTEDGLSLLDSGERDRLAELTEQLNCRLIIIDTLSTNFGDGDENGPEMAQFINGLNQVARETGAHIAIVHHAGKDAKKGARGGSAAKGNVYTYGKIEPLKDTPEKVQRSRLIVEKQKGSAIPDDKTFLFNSVDLGTVRNKWGDLKPVTTLTPYGEDDGLNSLQSLTRNLNNESARKLSSNQKTAVETLENEDKDRLKNNPAIQNYAITQSELAYLLRAIPQSSQYRTINWLEENAHLKSTAKGMYERKIPG